NRHRSHSRPRKQPREHPGHTVLQHGQVAIWETHQRRLLPTIAGRVRNYAADDNRRPQPRNDEDWTCDDGPGAVGQFGLDVQNTGSGDAWNVTLLDRFPKGNSGGTCSTTPQILSAQVFQADGVTPVAGKGPLVPGTDFSVSYAAPTCQLTLTMLTAAGTIG